MEKKGRSIRNEEVIGIWKREKWEKRRKKLPER
jgi:hypothetical protein